MCGPAYTSQSPIVDAEDLVNWTVEASESPNATSAFALYPTPGLKKRAELPESPFRGEIYANGRLFVVGGKRFCEVTSDYTVTVRNSAIDLVNDGAAVSMAASNSQVLLSSGGRLYYFLLDTNEFGEIDTILDVAVRGPVAMVGYSDGYFFALLKNSRRFQISDLSDVKRWDPASISDILFCTDNVVSLFIDHREPWFFASKQTIPYYNTGNADFPYSPVPGAFIEDGIAAQFSPTKLDNSLFWIASDERGWGIGKRAQGYTPVRVTNHAVEWAWSQYPTLSDAISYSYQDKGHTYWVISFPSANQGQGATWVYDVSTGFWHRRGQWNGATYGIHPAQFHAFAFNKHLVGGLESNILYEMSTDFYDDDGTPIRRMRRAPAIQSEDVWVYFNRLTIDVEVGDGPQPPLLDGEGEPRAPQIMLDWSNYASRTWRTGGPLLLDCGKSGEYGTQVFATRLGRARKGRVFEISCSDPVPWRIADAYLRATPGFDPVGRLTKELQKAQ
jgi:hypothetical protein